MFKRLPLLSHYCRTLGLLRGFRYWRESNRCAHNPELVDDYVGKKITVKGPNKPRHKIRIVHANGAQTIVNRMRKVPRVKPKSKHATKRT